jgi:hypothetical protein
VKLTLDPELIGRLLDQGRRLDAASWLESIAAQGSEQAKARALVLAAIGLRAIGDKHAARGRPQALVESPTSAVRAARLLVAKQDYVTALACRELVDDRPLGPRTLQVLMHSLDADTPDRDAMRELAQGELVRLDFDKIPRRGYRAEVKRRLAARWRVPPETTRRFAWNCGQ